MDKCAFVFSEAKLAHKWGISRGDAKQLRDEHLGEGDDWKNIGGQIALTARGVQKMRGRVGTANGQDLSDCRLDAEPIAKKEPPLLLCDRRPPEPIKLTVERTFMNPGLLEARDARGAVYRVLVNNNSNFLRGMELTALPDVANAGFYRLIGGLPKYRGRWI